MRIDLSLFTMKQSNKEFVYGLIGFFILVLISGLITHFKNKNLLNSHKLGTGVITDVIHLRNSGGRAFVKYRFIDLGVEYRIQESIDCLYSDNVLVYLKGRQVSIIYRPEHPKNSHLLLSFTDFKKFDIKATNYDSTIILGLNSVCK